MHLDLGNNQPTDLVKQSIPFAYMAISAASTDGASHSVQVYSDISAEWVSGDNSLTVNWSTNADSVITHQVQLASQIPFSEINDHTQCKTTSFFVFERWLNIDIYAATDGSAFFSTLSVRLPMFLNR